ncbi:MAG: HAD hydrolase-like protein, partial [Candidatus Parcubacteria bacterium]|nr:HAD hydrolase-like protein [Candidatus Parcubacteria bacterium]
LLLTQQLKDKCWPFGKILNLNDEIDAKIAGRSGFGQTRFPVSWVKTYQQICRELEISPQPKIERKIYDLASDFWKPPFRFFPGAKKMLRELRTRGYYLVLLTAGDREVQQFKIDDSRAERYFDEVIIVPKDKTPVLRRFVKRFGRSNVTMIGNSAHSDMEPAIQSQVKGVYIPMLSDDWSYHQLHDVPVRTWKRYVTQIKSLNQVLTLFPRKTEERR